MAKHNIRITFGKPMVDGILIGRNISRCIKAVLQEEGVTAGCEINVLITDNPGIHEINRLTRKVDRPTDVLSFPMFELTAGAPPTDWTPFLDPETGLCPLGDMCLSLEQAAAQAKEFGHSLKREVGYLTIHSMLHLLGYDHLDEGPMKAKMRAREEYIAGKLGLTRD